MEKQDNYWKENYFKVYAENRKLRLELERLKEDYNELKEQLRNKEGSGLLRVPSKKKSMKISSLSDSNRLQTMTSTIVAPAYDICKLEDPGLKSSFKFSASNPTRPRITNEPSTGCTDPDINPDLYLFEDLFIIGVSTDFKSSSILDRYLNNFQIPAFEVLHDFCFPAGIHIRQLILSDSASELNRLLYGQNITQRNENMFVFTLKPLETQSSIQYSSLDVLYFCCIVIEDIAKFDSHDWIVPKCYCLASYFPLFDLHFQFLSKLLYMTRIRRMEELGGLTASIQDFSSPDLTLSEKSFLESYRCKSEPLGGSTFLLLVSMQDPISLHFPSDFHSIESIWLCTPIFSILRFEDFFWLWNAVLLEKSIVVVSCNLALLTSVVLALRNMIRPLLWQHVLLPIVPDSLRELIEAPVPLLIGIPAPAPPLRKSYKGIVWVMLDEPDIRRRLQPGKKVLAEVKEMYSAGIKEKLGFEYARFGNNGVVYQPSEKQAEAVRGVVVLMVSALKSLLRALPKIKKIDFQMIQNVLENSLSKFNQADHLFLKSFFTTQLIVHYLESTLDCKI